MIASLLTDTKSVNKSVIDYSTGAAELKSDALYGRCHGKCPASIWPRECLRLSKLWAMIFSAGLAALSSATRGKNSLVAAATR